MERLGQPSNQELSDQSDEESVKTREEEEQPKTHSDKEEQSSNQKTINLIKQLKLRKWYSKVNIFIGYFKFNTKDLFDSGADLNCIQKGFIPTKYYKKSKESLGTALW